MYGHVQQRADSKQRADPMYCKMDDETDRRSGIQACNEVSTSRYVDMARI